MTQRAALLVPTAKDEQDRLPARENFVRALYWLLEERTLSQRDLAEMMGWSSHTKMNPWRNLRSEPTPAEVFDMERALKVPSGTLSVHLGYRPLEEKRALGVEDAIDADPMLPDWGKRLLKTSYREIRNSRAHRSKA